ncbi:serine hydrolase domain-containing protein [Microlunatus flavus]|uniref:CubicO group peptidase, beta-lactamase class C family n=1 Tax=Microlunatus flavus TaxID=1036181 RepID=A0A1H9AF70_9ACTN|nr:serine hydrolase domain-containing protein [Microlunatus flavus]SEP75309.1 CubicO group peptidase, beta-lactamase class C family [Microlunatus flavus]
MSAARRTGLAVAALVVGTTLGLLLGFRGPALGPTSTGDAGLAADLRASLASDRGLVGLAAARVRDGEVRVAGLGLVDGAVPGPSTPFELGSITKTFTAALLADAVERGEVGLDDPLARHLPELAGSDAGESTLRQLATHTSGLPPFPTSSAPLVLLRVVGNAAPYGGTVVDLLEASRGTGVGERGAYRYSNLGVALLGHALARAAGAPDWAALLRDRVLEPLGMTGTVVTGTVADVPAGAARPHRDNGWRAPFWTGPAFAPAGSSTVTTAADLATWARALLDGTAPGATALEPVSDIPGGRIGLLWHVREVDGRTVTWHNGGTGGSRTMLALDRDRGQAVLVLGNSGRDVDAAALHLAAATPGAPVPGVDRPAVSWAGLAGWGVLGVLLLGTAVLRWRTPHGWALLDGAAAAGTGLLVLLVHGPWQLLPTAVWGGLALAVVTLGVVAARGPRPPAPTTRPVRTVSLVSTAAVLALALWSW